MFYDFYRIYLKAVQGLFESRLRWFRICSTAVSGVISAPFQGDLRAVSRVISSPFQGYLRAVSGVISAQFQGYFRAVSGVISAPF